MSRLILGLLSALAVAVASIVPAAAQPVEPGKEGELAKFLSPRPGARICYARKYSAEHLNAHPKQQVTEIEFRLTYYEHEKAEDLPKGQRNYYFALRARLRNKPGPLTAFGECSPRDGAILCGVECDGGGVMVKRRPEDKALVFFSGEGSYIRMSEGCDEEENTYDLKPGADDKEFLLTKTDDAACPVYEDW